MAITLNATLKTAQDGINHRPIAEIISSPMGEVIPTVGNYFNTLTTTEYKPQIISLSTGQLAVIMQRWVGSEYQLYYLYTPEDRSEWIEVHVTTPYALWAADPCICELPNGNIGIVFIAQKKLYYKIISSTGSIVTDFTLLYDAGSNWIGNPYVITLANDDFLLVYPEGTGNPPSESNTYYLQQRTSSNFTSWSAATDIRPDAFATTRYCNNPHLLQVTSGRIFLHVDYLNQYTNLTELNNIYMMHSDDNGSAWSTAEKVTNFIDLGQSATHPTATEKENGDITFMYAERSLVKMLDKNMTGYPYDEIKESGKIYFDPNSRQIHWQHRIHSVVPPKEGLTTINIDSWVWKRTLTESSIPALDTGVMEGMFRSDCEWFSAESVGFSQPIQAINMITESSKLYQWGFAPSDPHVGVTYIVDMTCGYADNDQIAALVVTHNGIQKLYILHLCGGHGSYDNSLGWIDLNEVKDPITGLYAWNEIWTCSYPGPGITISKAVLYDGDVKWDYVHNYFCTHTWGDPQYIGQGGGLCVWNENGTIVLKLSHGNVAGFPSGGCKDFQFVGEDVYFSFPYYSGEPDKRGLGHYQAATESVIFHQPTWATVNDYQLSNFVDMGDGRILMISNNTLANGGGIVIYDTNTGGWTVFNDDTFSGFGRTNSFWTSLAYDSITKTIFAVYSNTLIAFSEYGPYSLLQYTDIDNVDTTIDYGDYITFNYHLFGYEPNIVYDVDNILWAVWRHVEDGTEYSAKWANLLDDIEITNEVAVAPISIEWDIEKPAKLTFSLSKGHLYDPNNLMSTLSPFLKKGRKIVVKFGETVSDTDYLQKQGEFCIKSVSLEYKTDKYPEAKIVGEDLRVLWEDTEVVATMYYENQTPHNVLENILLNHASMVASEFDIPGSWTNEHNLYHQFIEMDLDDIVKELLDHFGYYPFVNIDGKFEPRHVNLSKTVDHTYSNTVQLIQYTPNDAYSTFINRVAVKGISHVYSEVLYEEENITSISGTTGWWGKKSNETVWYSNDHNRTCRNPRLEIVQSITEFRVFGIKTGGGTEYMSSVDPDEHYVIIMIESPDLIAVFIGTVAAVVATGIAAIGCDGFISGWCGWAIFQLCMLLNILMYILGAVASYNYNIWARPIGHEKSTFQAQADDEEFQKELGNKIVPVSIDDAMAYTIAICQQIANQELEVVKAQRRRLKFKKTTHLQDEIGDVLELVQPYSGETLKIFVPRLKRTMRIGKDFVDEIDGWRIMS